MRSIIIAAALLSQSLGARAETIALETAHWTCKALSEEEELTIHFVESKEGVISLSFSDGDSPRHLRCAPASDDLLADGFESFCSMENDSVYLTASVMRVGRALLRAVNFLEVYREDNTTIRTDFECYQD